MNRNIHLVRPYLHAAAKLYRLKKIALSFDLDKDRITQQFGLCALTAAFPQAVVNPGLLFPPLIPLKP
jgi:hypothetical protein